MLGKVFGSRNQRLVKSMNKVVKQINALEGRYEALSDADLQGMTETFRDRIAAGETVDDLLPEAFAVCREASKRVLGMRHFDVQLIGGMVLNEGKISEMRTGEGKTLVATLAAYLNALPGRGVHVITVNDYLAERDANWMGKLYGFLGLSTGVVISGQTPEQKHEAYHCDITYGTNNEFGFDYLRDNMAFSPEERVQRDKTFAIVDEVDSILIDEARTPLIISGPSDDDVDMYVKINKLISGLTPCKEDGGPGDFVIDEKGKQVNLTDEGHQHVESILEKAGVIEVDDSLYSTTNIVLLHYVGATLRAKHLFKRDVDYMVINGEIVIVDEFTGRPMPGRRWSDGLHQAMEAKEGITVNQESQTLASITFQNYFRLYEKLSGMTGTADTEAFEFQSIYGLEVVVIPTHRDVQREDYQDRIYLTQQEKFDAILEDIREAHGRQQPVLVGTASIKVSEYVANLLDREGIPHKVLNAKQHGKEAGVIEHAGRPGAVTIATNMAGRGTDIVLGGSLDAELEALGDKATESQIAAVKEDWKTRHQQVLQNGGLHVVGTERHESRRIDNQLRGRSGRQGDPGSTRFYLSLEDNLMRIFASPRMAQWMQRLGMEKGEAIEANMVNKAIESAQRKVEGHNFDIRKNLLEYDDVANDQRKVVYSQRDDLMVAERVDDIIENVRRDVVDAIVALHMPQASMEEQWDVPALERELKEEFGVDYPVAEWLATDKRLNADTISERIVHELVSEYEAKEAQVADGLMRQYEKMILMNVLDKQWKEHLSAMDQLRRGINLRSYANKNPKEEYKREAFQMFTQMLDGVKSETIALLSKVEIETDEEIEEVVQDNPLGLSQDVMEFKHDTFEEDEDVMGDAEIPPEPQPAKERKRRTPPASSDVVMQGTQVRDFPKVGRNEPCPCGSGKKYKHCHGKV